MKKGSKAAKAWGAKMRRLRGGGTKRKKSTRKGQRRKTARRAYEGIKRKAKSYKRRKSSSGMKFPKFGGTAKKIAIGLGAAQIAGLALGMIAPQLAPIAKPVAALAAGGIPGVAAELVLDQGLLGNVFGMFNGGGMNEQRLASGL
jgi:hypothetical protein